MRISWRAVGAVMLAAGMMGGVEGRTQSTPTASQALEISVFVAPTFTYTELGGGRNGAFTAGGDLSFRSYFHVRPSLEIRGSYPYRRGHVDGQESVLIGPKFSKDYGRFHPYVDGFFGRGALTYEDGGIVIGNFRYVRTTTNVFAGGIGLDYRLTRRLDAKADLQFERWSTPVTDGGAIYPIPQTYGLVYHLDFNRRAHKPKKAKREAASTP